MLSSLWRQKYNPSPVSQPAPVYPSIHNKHLTTTYFTNRDQFDDTCNIACLHVPQMRLEMLGRKTRQRISRWLRNPVLYLSANQTLVNLQRYSAVRDVAFNVYSPWIAKFPNLSPVGSTSMTLDF